MSPARPRSAPRCRSRPTGSPSACSRLPSARSTKAMSPAFCTLGTITQSSDVTRAADHLAQVVEGELAGDLVDPDHAHLALPVVAGQRLDDLGARARLLQRGAGVLEVEEDLVGRAAPPPSPSSAGCCPDRREQSGAGARACPAPLVSRRRGGVSAASSAGGEAGGVERAADGRRGDSGGRGAGAVSVPAASPRRVHAGKPRPPKSLASSSGPPRSSWTRSIIRIIISWSCGSSASFSWTPPSWPMRSLTAASCATCISTGWLAAATTIWNCSRSTSNPLQAMQSPWCPQRQSRDLSGRARDAGR